MSIPNTDEAEAGEVDEMRGLESDVAEDASAGQPLPALPTVQETIDALRPLLEKAESSARRTSRRAIWRRRRWPVPVWATNILLVAGIAAMLGWAFTLEEPSAQDVAGTRDLVLGETLTRSAPTTVTTSTTTTSTTTSPIVAAEPGPAPATSGTSTTVAPAPSTTTTTAAAAPLPRDVPASSTSETVGNVRLTLAAKPVAGTRTAAFGLTAEFGDVRVLRAIRLSFGDGKTSDQEVHDWRCWDPAAPNPHVFTGSDHAYSAPGSYTVTATVRTSACAPGDDDGLPEETAHITLVLAVR